MSYLFFAMHNESQTPYILFYSLNCERFWRKTETAAPELATVRKERERERMK